MIQNHHLSSLQNSFSPTLVAYNYYKSYNNSICDINPNKNYIFYFRPTNNSDWVYTGYIHNNIIYPKDDHNYTGIKIENGQFVVSTLSGYSTIYEI